MTHDLLCSSTITTHDGSENVNGNVNHPTGIIIYTCSLEDALVRILVDMERFRRRNSKQLRTVCIRRFDT